MIRHPNYYFFFPYNRKKYQAAILPIKENKEHLELKAIVSKVFEFCFLIFGLWRQDLALVDHNFGFYAEIHP